MPRATRKLIAGTAAAAAKKVLPKRMTAEAAAEPDTRTTGKTTSRTTAKKAAAKKAPTRTPATRTAAQPAATQTAAGAPARKATSKASAKKAPAKKAAATKAPAKKTATKRTATKRTATKKPAASTTSGSAAQTPARTSTTTTRTTKAKKAPVKKTASSAPTHLVVKEGEEAWTKAELDEVLAELNEHADRLRHELHDQEEELAGLMRDAGDGAGQDQADLGATSFERDHELTVVNNSREMLAQTERALARIEDGTYGVCESCGNPIGKMRLMAFPRATLCMSCKQREERR